MNPVSIDVKDWLEGDSSLGLTFGTNLHVASMPATPKDCVAVFDTPGSPRDLTMDNVAYLRPSFQVRVRTTDYEVGWALINDITNLLHGKSHVTLDNGTVYEVIRCAQEPFLLGRTENNELILIGNFEVQRR